MSAALLFVLSLASVYLVLKIIALIDSHIDYWKAAAEDREAARTRKRQRGKGSFS